MRQRWKWRDNIQLSTILKLIGENQPKLERLKQTIFKPKK